MIVEKFSRAQLVMLGAHFPVTNVIRLPSKNAIKARRWRANNREHWLAKNRQYVTAFRERQKQKELTHA